MSTDGWLRRKWKQNYLSHLPFIFPSHHTAWYNSDNSSWKYCFTLHKCESAVIVSLTVFIEINTNGKVAQMLWNCENQQKQENKTFLCHSQSMSKPGKTCTVRVKILRNPGMPWRVSSQNFKSVLNSTHFFNWDA